MNVLLLIASRLATKHTSLHFESCKR